MARTPRDTEAPARRQVRQNGAAIKALREKDCWTQPALARVAGIRQATLSNIENEKDNASVPTLNAIARAMRIPVGAIMRGHDGDVLDPAQITEGAA